MLLCEVKPLEKPLEPASTVREEMDVFEPRPAQTVDATESDRDVNLVILDAGIDAVLRADAFNKVDRLALLFQRGMQILMGEEG
jgi:hypothetical protein